MTSLRRSHGSCKYFIFASSAILVFLINGCSGSGNNSNTAHVRAFNGIENGGSATIFINSGSANGSQNFDQSSAYLYLNGGDSTFTLTLSSYLSNAYPTVSHNLQNGQYYTVITFGRPDVGATDLRYPSLAVLDDNNTAPPSGDAFVRIFDAATDAGALSATAGSTSVASSLTLGQNGGYVAVPAGSVPISWTLASGTLATSNFNLTAGDSYTIVVDESTIPSGITSSSFGTVQLTDK